MVCSISTSVVEVSGVAVVVVSSDEPAHAAVNRARRKASVDIRRIGGTLMANGRNSVPVVFGVEVVAGLVNRLDLAT